MIKNILTALVVLCAFALYVYGFYLLYTRVEMPIWVIVFIGIPVTIINLWLLIKIYEFFDW